MNNDNDRDIMKIKQFFGDKWAGAPCTKLFIVKWYHLSAIGKHKILPVAYPILLILPIILSIVDYYGLDQSRYPIKPTVFASFYAAFFAIIFHLCYLLLSPRSVKMFSGKDEMIGYIKNGNTTISYEDTTLMVRVEKYWEFVNCSCGVKLSIALLMLSCSVICMLYIIFFNVYMVTLYVIKYYS